MLRDGDEAGFTVVELVVAMGMLLVVLGALLGGLGRLFNSERTASTHVDDEQSARFLMASFTQDVHSAVQIFSKASLAAYSTQADVKLIGGSEVVWSYDGTSTITRTAGTSVTTYRSVVNGSSGPPVFSWFSPNGTNLAPFGWGTPADVASCTASIQISLQVKSRQGVTPILNTTQVGLPNRTSLEGCS